MKNVPQKVNTLFEVMNSLMPEKYLKFKFQDFCVDLFFSEEEVGAFILEEDYQDILAEVEKSGIILDGPNKEILLRSFAFGIFMFYSYADFCLKSASLTKRSMKRFTEKVSNNYFGDNFPQLIFDYYNYIKREGNSALEQETIAQTEAIFPFFSDLAEFQFSFHSPTDDEDRDKEDIGVSIKNSYSCYINTICLSFSTFVNFLNSLSIFNELASVEPDGIIEKKETDNGTSDTDL